MSAAGRCSTRLSDAASSAPQPRQVEPRTSPRRVAMGWRERAPRSSIPGLLTRFAAERPGVEIVLREAHNPLDLLDLVEAQELDVTFCSGVDLVGDRPFASRVVLEDPFVLLAPVTPPWTDRPSVTLDEITTHPLIGNRNPSCYTETLRSFGDRHPSFVFHSDDNTTVQSCVAAGLGVALTPMLTIDVDDPTTTIVPVTTPLAPRLIAIAWLAGRRPSALLDAFVDAAGEVCRGIAEGWAAEVGPVA